MRPVADRVYPSGGTSGDCVALCAFTSSARARGGLSGWFACGEGWSVGVVAGGAAGIAACGLPTGISGTLSPMYDRRYSPIACIVRRSVARPIMRLASACGIDRTSSSGMPCARPSSDVVIGRIHKWPLESSAIHMSSDVTVGHVPSTP